MTGEEGAAGAPLAAAKGTMVELLDIVGDWLAPLVFLLVGFYIGPQLGLSGLFYTILDGTVPNSVTQSNLVIIADVIAGVIWIAIGGGIFHMGGEKGAGKIHIKRWAMRSLGLFFVGCGLGEFANLSKKTVSNGILGTAGWKTATGN